MNNSLLFFVCAGLFTTLTTGLYFALSAVRNRKVEDRHLYQLMGSLAVSCGILAYANGNEIVTVSGLLAFLWSLCAYTLISSDLTGKKEWTRTNIGIVFAGLVISLVCLGFKLPFFVASLPFAIATFVVAGLVGLNVFKSTVTNITKVFYGFSGLYFFSAVLFCFLRTTNLEAFLLFNLFSVAGMCLGAYGMKQETLTSGVEQDLQRQMKERNEKIVGNSKYSELGMMAAGIAHEINNPLAVIQARTTQLLRIYRDPSKVQELSEGLQQILYTSERINRTIQGVREFVHDERSSMKEIKLKELIDDVLAFCGQRMKNHGVNLRFYGIENQMVWGNKVQIEQVLLNLLNNSFDAIEFLSDKWIEVSASQTDNILQIQVKDSGSGIPPEIAEHIMEPFYSTKDIGKGTGLGLALAKGIAEKHGGHLSYVKGSAHTTFSLDLPRRPSQGDWGQSASSMH